MLEEALRDNLLHNMVFRILKCFCGTDLLDDAKLEIDK